MNSMNLLLGRKREIGMRLPQIFLLALLLAGCSMPEMLVRQGSIPSGATIKAYDYSLHQPLVHAFDRIDVSAVVAHEQRQPKIDTLLVLFDLAGLQGRNYRNIEADVYAREVIRRMHQTIPENIQINGDMFLTAKQVAKVIAPDVSRRYNPAYFETALNNRVGIIALQGASLASAIDQLAVDSIRRPGRLAIVLVTSWERIDASAENAVIRLRQRHESIKGLNVTGMDEDGWSGRLQPGHCLYAIGVGNVHSRERLYTPETCGSYWAVDAVMQPSEMASFVLDVLYAPPSDSDGDGVPNYLDRCESTPLGRIVTSQGCLRFPAAAESDGKAK